MGESTEDLAGGFSKYREELLARTGVDIQDEAGNYRDLYDIFVDLAGVWDNLADDQSRARVGEILGGTRNQAAIMSTIRNIKDAIGAYDSAVNSAGVAERANEKFMETTDAHLKQLKASWEELSYDLFESDFLKFFVDLGRGIIEVLDAIIDKIGILGALLATGGIVAFFKGGGVAGLVSGFSQLYTVIERVVVTAGGLGAALSVAIPVVGIIAAVTAFTLLNESFGDAKTKADEAMTSYKGTQEKLEGVNRELETTRARMDELKGKVLTPVAQEEYDKLVRMNSELERQQRILEHTAQVQREIAAREAGNVLTKDVGQYGYQEGSGDILDKIDAYTDLIKRQTGKRDHLLDSMDENTSKQKELEEKIGEYSEDEKKVRQPWEIWKEASPYEKDLRDLTNLRKEQTNYENELKSTDKTLQNLEEQRSKDIETAQNYHAALLDDQGNVIHGYEDIADKYNAVMDRVDQSLGIISDGQVEKEIRKAFDLSDSTEQLNEWYNSLSDSDKELVYSIVINNTDEARDNIREQLEDLGEGGGVDLNMRPVIDAKELTKAGWEEAGEGAATVFSSTFSNEAGNIAMNFTPIIADDKGNFKGVLSPEQLSTYASEVINGTRSDDLGLQIGAAFTGEDAIDQAVAAAEEIHELHEQIYLTPDQASMTLDDYITQLEILGQQAEEDVGGIKELTTVFTEQKQGYDKFQKTISSIQGVLSSQTTGKSIGFDSYSSDELKAYTSALEYHNGVLQYNVDKVNEITAAKSEEEKATIAYNKAQAQSQYLQNASEIDRLRESLNGLSEEDRLLAENSINTLLGKNAELAAQCEAYNLMAASIDEATSAYQHWINAQGATQSGAMFDSSLTAFNKIRDTINGKGDKNSADGWLKTGNEDYQAALDFVIPDTVDREDVNAVESYMNSIKSYLRFDKDGNVDGLNVESFLQDAVNKGLMTVDEAGEDFQVAGGKTMQDFADGLNLSMPLVQAIFGELEEYDFHFDWADEAPKTLGDLAVNANEAAEAFRGMEEYSDIRLVLDVSKFEDADKATEALNNNIKQMNRVKSKVGVDASDVERANTIIQYCVAQKQALSQPAVMYVDTSQVSGQIGEALELLQQFQGIQNDIEMQASIGADTSDAEAALDEVAGKINSLPEDIKATLNIDTSSVDSIESYIQGLDAEAMVKFGVDSSAVDGYQAADQDPTVTYHLNAPPEPKYKDQHPDVTYSLHAPSEPVYNNIERTITYTYQTKGSKPSGAVQGTAHAFGTARASGDWGTAPGGTTLVGELG